MASSVSKRDSDGRDRSVPPNFKMETLSQRPFLCAPAVQGKAHGDPSARSIPKEAAHFGALAADWSVPEGLVGDAAQAQSGAARAMSVTAIDRPFRTATRPA